MLEELDFKAVCRLGGVCMFYVCIAMLLWLYLGDSMQSLVQKLLPSRPVMAKYHSKEELSVEEMKEQQRVARQKIQDDHETKAEDFRERVMKPREAAKQAALEKEYYKFAGPAWKGKGQATRPVDKTEGATGGASPGTESRVPGLRRRDLEGTGRDAASARKLPGSVTNPPRPNPTSAQPKKTKMVITLPDEPEVGTPESITVAVRGTSGVVKKRRFLYTEKTQVLLDWMMTMGYHQTVYTLLTTYPRRDLSHDAQQTLEEAGINRDTALVVEERDRDEET